MNAYHFVHSFHTFSAPQPWLPCSSCINLSSLLSYFLQTSVIVIIIILQSLSNHACFFFLHYCIECWAWVAHSSVFIKQRGQFCESLSLSERLEPRELKFRHILLPIAHICRLWFFLPLLLVQRSICTEADSVVLREGGETSLRYQSATAS